MSYARALRCRTCGQEYPVQPLNLCDFCLSPLEVSYDYKAMAKEYYQILSAPRNATNEHIKKAFNILGDPEKRGQYDQFGTVGNVGDIFGSPFTRTTFEDLMKDFGGSGLGFDFLDNIFGDFLKGRGFSFKTFGTQAYVTPTLSLCDYLIINIVFSY